IKKSTSVANCATRRRHNDEEFGVRFASPRQSRDTQPVSSPPYRSWRKTVKNRLRRARHVFGRSEPPAPSWFSAQLYSAIRTPEQWLDALGSRMTVKAVFAVTRDVALAKLQFEALVMHRW